MLESSLLIGDERRNAAAGAVYLRRNPVTGEVASRAAAASVTDAQAAALAAAGAFEAWAALARSL